MMTAEQVRRHMRSEPVEYFKFVRIKSPWQGHPEHEVYRFGLMGIDTHTDLADGDVAVAAGEVRIRDGKCTVCGYSTKLGVGCDTRCYAEIPELLGVAEAGDPDEQPPTQEIALRGYADGVKSKCKRRKPLKGGLD